MNCKYYCTANVPRWKARSVQDGNDQIMKYWNKQYPTNPAFYASPAGASLLANWKIAIQFVTNLASTGSVCFWKSVGFNSRSPILRLLQHCSGNVPFSHSLQLVSPSKIHIMNWYPWRIVSLHCYSESWASLMIKWTYPITVTNKRTLCSQFLNNQKCSKVSCCNSERLGNY